LVVVKFRYYKKKVKILKKRYTENLILIISLEQNVNMKLLTFITLIFFFGCSDNKYQDISIKIKEKLNKDALGIDLKYKSLELYPVDTLTVEKEIFILSNKTSQPLK